MIKERQIGAGAFGTHITPLMAAVLKTTGPVVEFGMGDYSTPLLHELIRYQRGLSKMREIHSYESDHNWLENFIDLRSSFHFIEFVFDWDEIDIPDRSVLFIDHAPADRRVIDIHKFRNKAAIIVVHDTEKSKYYGYEPVLSSFKYRFDYERYSKKTTILSNFIDITNIL